MNKVPVLIVRRWSPLATYGRDHYDRLTSYRYPILHGQIFYSRKFPNVVRHQSTSSALGMRRNQHIQWANRPAAGLQWLTQRPIPLGGIVIKRHDFKPLNEQ